MRKREPILVHHTHVRLDGTTEYTTTIIRRVPFMRLGFEHVRYGYKNYTVHVDSQGHRFIETTSRAIPAISGADFVVKLSNLS